MLWIALAVMTGLAMGFALWPLAFRKPPPPEEGREADFYRAQLAEIARDVERGVLPADEAASARTEAARRLLAVSENAPVAPKSALVRRRAAAVVAFVIVPAVSLALYAKLGRPEMPDAPLAARKADPNSSFAVEAAVARVEAHLMKQPDDRRGWEVLAPIYMRMGQFVDAAGAYKQVMRLGGDTPTVHTEYAEALVALSDGVVTAEARAEFDKAPELPMSKFYLALALEQDGKKDEAKAAYAALEPEAKGREPWMMGLRARLAALNGGPAQEAQAGQEGPAGQERPAGQKAPQGFSPDQRKMIEGMVAGLAARLADKGGSAEEWARLIRAYSVLQEADKARDALASARKALGQNADIDALARELGI